MREVGRDGGGDVNRPWRREWLFNLEQRMHLFSHREGETWSLLSCISVFIYIYMFILVEWADPVYRV